VAQISTHDNTLNHQLLPFKVWHVIGWLASLARVICGGFGCDGGWCQKGLQFTFGVGGGFRASNHNTLVQCNAPRLHY